MRRDEEGCGRDEGGMRKGREKEKLTCSFL